MIVSPLRYPGGKAKLYPFFVELIKKNRLFGSEYSEPYAGGAGLALKLLTYGFVKRISINDIDPSIYAFWQSALYKTDEFCSRIERTPITIEEWHKQKKIFTSCDTENALELGFAAFFLNRTNRSGIIEGAGPIGGYDQDGKWKIDARFIKDKQIANLKSLSKFSGQITVSNLDAMQFFSRMALKENAFVYLDPPYFVKGHKLYKNFYQPYDHQEIARMLKKNRRLPWVVSYDDVPAIREAYSSFLPVSYNLNYSAGSKTVGTEVIYLSDSLELPKVEGFQRAA